MPSFGLRLQRERERRAFSLDDVARDTRLARRYLQALESESIDNLPGGPYNRAYLRTYAKYLALDADSLIRDYDREARARSEAGQLTVGPDVLATMRAVVRQRASQRSARRTALPGTVRMGAITGLACAILAGAVWFGARGFRPQPEPIPIAASSERPARDESVEVSVGVTRSTSNPDRRRLESNPGRPEEPASTLSSAPTRGGRTVVAVASAASPSGAPRQTALEVSRSGVGTTVVDRELVGGSDTFAVGARVAFWTLVTGGRSGDVISHLWIHQGRLVGAVDLAIGSASWRTQSRRVLAPGAEGNWIVEARDAGGRVLARHEFHCEPRDSLQ